MQKIFREGHKRAGLVPHVAHARAVPIQIAAWGFALFGISGVRMAAIVAIFVCRDGRMIGVGFDVELVIAGFFDRSRRGDHDAVGIVFGDPVLRNFGVIGGHHQDADAAGQIRDQRARLAEVLVVVGPGAIVDHAGVEADLRWIVRQHEDQDAGGIVMALLFVTNAVVQFSISMPADVVENFIVTHHDRAAAAHVNSPRR